MAGVVTPDIELAMDAFVAATAEFHHLTLITRNAAHFESVVKDLLNPWAS